MKLYIARHASAEDIATTDASRLLTPIGRGEARVLGMALAKGGAKLTHVFSSPLIRARQTAEIAARELGFAGMKGELEELLNDTPTSQLMQAIRAHPAATEVLLVGHMPSVVGHVTELTSCGRMAGFTPAALACIELPAVKSRAAKLLWFKQHHELQV